MDSLQYDYDINPAGVKKGMETEDEIPYSPGQFTPGKTGADNTGMKNSARQFARESPRENLGAELAGDMVEDGLEVHHDGLPAGVHQLPYR